MSLSPANISDLNAAAQEYQFNQQLEKAAEDQTIVSSRGADRTRLERIAKLAVRVGEELRLLGPRGRVVLSREFDTIDLSLSDLDKILQGISVSAQNARREIPAAGRLARVERYKFIAALGAIYSEVTHRRPTRTHDPIAACDTGQFLEFVRAILGFVNPAAVAGCEHDVRKVIADMAEIDPETT